MVLWTTLHTGLLEALVSSTFDTSDVSALILANPVGPSRMCSIDLVDWSPGL